MFSHILDRYVVALNSGLMQFVFMLCFSIAPCFISFISSAITLWRLFQIGHLCARIFQVLMQPQKDFQCVFEMCFLPSTQASSSRVFSKKELLAYVLIQHTNDMTCPLGWCSHHQQYGLRVDMFQIKFQCLTLYLAI